MQSMKFFCNNPTSPGSASFVKTRHGGSNMIPKVETHTIRLPALPPR